MMRVTSIRAVFSQLFFLCALFVSAQPSYHFKLNTTRDICAKATASLELDGIDPADTISISWSTGVTNARYLADLDGGNYNVHVHIKHHQDSLLFVKDTTFYFSVTKELCEVSVDKYFSPNDDNYHDRMSVYNAEYHPNFELNIFNKWGQQVHSQKRSYTPWDGKWNGIELPDGTYYYIFFYDMDQRTLFVKGDVTILR